MRGRVAGKGPSMVKGLKGRNDVSPGVLRRSVLFRSLEAQVGSVGSEESRRQQEPYQEGLPSKQEMWAPSQRQRGNMEEFKSRVVIRCGL